MSKVLKGKKKKKSAAKNPLSSKAIIQDRRRNKELLRQTKTKGVHNEYTSPIKKY